MLLSFNMNNISVKINNNDSESNSNDSESNSNDSESNSNKFLKRFIKYYNDPVNQINIIRKDNKGKIGIYVWVNNINNEVYIGSGDPLYTRLCVKKDHLVLVV